MTVFCFQPWIRIVTFAAFSFKVSMIQIPTNFSYKLAACVPNLRMPK